MEQREKEVIITGVKIPFWDLVWFLVKLALASIPAVLIFYFVFALLGVAIGALLG